MTSCEHIIDDIEPGEASDRERHELSMPGIRETANNLLHRRESIALVSYERLLRDARSTFAEETDDARTRASWSRACGFLEDNQKRAIIQSRGRSPLPEITPNPDGSLDLFWSDEDFSLLVNVPAEEAEMIEYSGEAEGHTPVIGKIEQPACEPRIVDLLKR